MPGMKYSELGSHLTGQFILLCWGILLVYFAATAFAVKRTVERSGRGWRTAIFAALIAVLVLFRSGGGLLRYAATVLWSPTLAAGVIADAITAAGLAVALWARVVLGGNWSPSPVLKVGHELIERGPYAYVRHPIYSGVLLMFLGTVVLFGRAGGFAAWVAVFLGLWFKALQEERLLLAHFPAAYAEYKERVKALIPFVF
jgi:protein-S-isoprenylcysteine O-methyltransferase Ste14